MAITIYKLPVGSFTFIQCLSGTELLSLSETPYTTKRKQLNQQYFINYVFPDLKTENRNFRRRMPPATFLVHTGHDGSKFVSKFNKHQIARSPHPPYSPELSPCDFWLVGVLKGILKDREFHSHGEIEQAITMARNDLTFGEVQSVFHNWINRHRWVIENGGEYITE
jgi:histone-lysine N-methyltransferase SETMAR